MCIGVRVQVCKGVRFRFENGAACCVCGGAETARAHLRCCEWRCDDDWGGLSRCHACVTVRACGRVYFVCVRARVCACARVRARVRDRLAAPFKPARRAQSGRFLPVISESFPSHVGVASES